MLDLVSSGINGVNIIRQISRDKLMFSIKSGVHWISWGGLADRRISMGVLQGGGGRALNVQVLTCASRYDMYCTSCELYELC